ncbi:MAG: site-specific integrase [Blastocatellia bacterium]
MTKALKIYSQEKIDLPFDENVLLGKVADSSMKIYRNDFRAYVSFASTKEKILYPTTFVNWKDDLITNTKASPKTINRMLSCVKKIILEASYLGKISQPLAEKFNQVSRIKENQLKSRIKANKESKITSSQIEKLCQTPQLLAKELIEKSQSQDKETIRMRRLYSDAERLNLVAIRDSAILYTLASSGLKTSEVAKLKTNQVTQKSDTYLIVIKEVNDNREIPLSEQAYDFIQQWLAKRDVESEYIFNHFEDGSKRTISQEPISAVSLWRMVQKYAQLLDIANIKPQDFRKLVGSRIARRNPKQAQKILGHKFSSTTRTIYTSTRKTK